MGHTSSSLLRSVGARHAPPQREALEGDIDLRDKETPDAWISRNPELERLTETTLPALTQGSVTPARQSYVRNHGTVPRLNRATHRLVVKGLGLSHGARAFAMDELEALPAREVAVTFCCSGNRRREVNAVKPSVGVPFGPGAVRTGVFKGVPLVDLLARCGFDKARAHAQCHALRDDASPEGCYHGCFINFAGPANELPKGEYGTSLLLDHALDPANDILIAYEYNGEPLIPDHGFPIRCVIPGFIGGRMVKWLSIIEVAGHDSASHYYFHDNRFLPSSCTTLDRASKEGWWYRPQYIIGEMNINSVITRPSHGDMVLFLESGASSSTYKLEGFAYTGGGRRIVIVEVSLDAGVTWNSASKFWAWRLWKHKVPLARLVQAPSVQVRAWDGSFNTQPADVAWNVLGMMNNSRYTVSIQPARTRDGLEPGILFSHPQAPHAVFNMDKEFGRPPCEVEEQGKKPPAPTADKAGAFTLGEVARHDADDDLWLVVNGKVYDVTAFVSKHPGGAGIIQVNAGQPCLEFDDIHSTHAHRLLKKYCIGELVEGEEGEEEEKVAKEAAGDEAGTALTSPRAGEEKGGEAMPRPFLDPQAFQPCPLLEKKAVTHDTRRFRFGLAHPNQPLGLPLGGHVYLRAVIDGETVLRPYTPTSVEDQLGSFDLVVKVYAAGQDPKHQKGGKMSQHLDRLRLGDKVDVKGPVGRFLYKGRGMAKIGGRTLPYRITRLGMLAGGTGITPMYQLVQAILRDPRDATRCSLLFANRTPDDIILRPELEHLAEQEAAKAEQQPGEEPRFRVSYTVDRLPPRGEEEQAFWPYELGHVTADMIRRHLPPPGPGTFVAICGPLPFVHNACRPALEKLGFPAESCFEF